MEKSLRRAGFESDMILSKDRVLAVALWYALKNHAEAEPIDKCSFATVLSGLTTGMWGGFGTDNYEKERVALNAAIALAGGVPPSGSAVVGLFPAEKATEKLTLLIFYFLEELYFIDSGSALLWKMASMDREARRNFALAVCVTEDVLKKVSEIIDSGKFSAVDILDIIGFPVKVQTAKEFLKWSGWEGDIEKGLAILGEYLGKGDYFVRFPDSYVLAEDGMPLYVLDDEPFAFQEYAEERI